MNFTYLTTGDAVGRLFPGGAIMPMRVIDVDHTLVYCTREGLTGDEARQAGLIWMFDRSTGAEVDHTLGWGPMYGKTGTALVPKEQSTETKRRH
jgi:hypothetical protein